MEATDRKIVDKVLSALRKDGQSAIKATEYVMLIGARRIDAWQRYSHKVAQAKAGRKVSFETRRSVKWAKAPRAKRPPRKTAKPANAPVTTT